MDDVLYTVSEVAQILKTNTAYVYRLKDAGLLRFLKIGRLKCRKSTLEAFMARYEGMDITDPENIKPLDAEYIATEAAV